MNYRIDEIEGIGPVYTEKLSAVGITTTEQLLEKCASAAGRNAIEKGIRFNRKAIARLGGCCRFDESQWRRSTIWRAIESRRCGHD